MRVGFGIWEFYTQKSEKDEDFKQSYKNFFHLCDMRDFQFFKTRRQQTRQKFKIKNRDISGKRPQYDNVDYFLAAILLKAFSSKIFAPFFWDTFCSSFEICSKFRAKRALKRLSSLCFSSSWVKI